MRKCIWLLVMTLPMVIAVSVGGVASGNDTACGDVTTPYYTGVTPLAADTYDVYVKLGKPGQTAEVDGYMRASQSNDGCHSIGALEAAGDEWRKLGVYQQTGDEGEVSFQLSSVVLANLPDANRPSLLLVSHTRPACVPAVECETTVDGAKAFIRPNSNSLAENSLRIAIAKDVNDDRVERVLYYVNNELMYQTKTLESFDMHAVPYYGTVMTRVIEYASGQTVVLQNDVPLGHVEDLVSMLTRTAKKYANTLLLSAIILGVLIAIRLVKALIYYQRKRYYWQVWHGFIKEKAPLRSLADAANGQLVRRIYAVFEVAVLVGIAVVGLVLFINTYVGQMAVVRGSSMETAYRSGQNVIVNKLPVTFARLNHADFIPRRGEVVVARPSYGASVDGAEAGGEVIVKRVIGLPGDKVVVKDGGEITIFNTTYPNGFKPEVGTNWAGFVRSNGGPVGDIIIVLNENELFLVGDNRPVSIDSRFNGPVAARQLIGVVVR